VETWLIICAAVAGVGFLDLIFFSRGEEGLARIARGCLIIIGAIVMVVIGFAVKGIGGTLNGEPEVVLTTAPAVPLEEIPICTAKEYSVVLKKWHCTKWESP